MSRGCPWLRRRLGRTARRTHSSCRKTCGCAQMRTVLQLCCRHVAAVVVQQEPSTASSRGSSCAGGGRSGPGAGGVSFGGTSLLRFVWFFFIIILRLNLQASSQLLPVFLPAGEGPSSCRSSDRRHVCRARRGGGAPSSSQSPQGMRVNWMWLMQEEL